MQIEIIRNDITSMKIDAIVLPANSKLKEGKGTSNAIYEKAGRRMLEKELKQFGPVSVGQAVPTLGYNLETDFIIHTVVPKWIEGKHQEYELLCVAYLSALSLADNMGCKEIAFPLLASGNNGFDLRLAFEIALQSFTTYVATNKLEKVYLVVYDRDTMAMLRSQGISVKEYIDEKYVLEKAMERKLPIEHVLEFGRDLAYKFVDDGIEMTKKYVENTENRKTIMVKAMDFIKDEENQKKLMDMAVNLTKIASFIVKNK